MAVRAQQHPSDSFSPDPGGRSRSKIFEDPRILMDHDYQIGNRLGVQLTCNASGPRKRSREDPSSITTTSTSGRSIAVSASSPVVSHLDGDLVSQLYYQSLDFDSLVRLQSEMFRSGLEEARRRQQRNLLSLLENHVSKRLRVKEAELECASRRCAELEEKMRQMNAENQILVTAAMDGETIVSSLRACIEQALFQGFTAAAAPPTEEGFGESDGIMFPSDEEGERREDEELRWRIVCRACREQEVCVLLLPCRHLCLCKDCEPKMDTCPVCRAVRNASLQIIMS